MPFILDEQYILAAEAELGCKLPKSYRHAMMQINGGEIIIDEDEPVYWTLFPIKDISDKKRIIRTCNDILRETKSAKQWDFFPDADFEPLFIAEDSAGNYLFFKIENGQIRPEVFYVDHEIGEDVQIADDFSQLERA